MMSVISVLFFLILNAFKVSVIHSPERVGAVEVVKPPL